MTNIDVQKERVLTICKLTSLVESEIIALEKHGYSFEIYLNEWTDKESIRINVKIGNYPGQPITRDVTSSVLILIKILRPGSIQ